MAGQGQHFAHPAHAAVALCDIDLRSDRPDMDGASEAAESGFVFGLVKGQPTDLIVHEWMPEKPLIKSVYLGRI